MGCIGNVRLCAGVFNKHWKRFLKSHSFEAGVRCFSLIHRAMLFVFILSAVVSSIESIAVKE